MTAFPPDSLLGIDMAKAKADTHFLRVGSAHKPTHRIDDNTPAGHEQLVSWLAAHQVGHLHVCLEATGTSSQALALRLFQVGYRVSIVNPLRIKRYGESELLRIKSDKTDAALIARFCLTQQPDPWTPPPAACSQLQDLVRSLHDLQHLHQQQANRQQSGPHGEAVIPATTAVLTCLATQMTTLRERIEQPMLAHASLKADDDLLLSICGSGKATAALLLAELGDVRRFATGRQLAA